MEVPQSIFGLHSWGWEIVHGSILDINLGIPWLYIREPIVSRSKDPKNIRVMAKRRVVPVGEWVISTETVGWRIDSRYGRLIGSEVEPRDPMHRDILQDLDGQKLLGIQQESSGMTLKFDLGGELCLWKFEDFPVCKIFHHGEHYRTIE